MSIADRITAFKTEKRSLEQSIRTFAEAVTKARGETTPGNHFRGYRLAPDGRYDDWNQTRIIDERPHIVTYWEYADCGTSPVWFPAYYMDVPEEQWRAEIAEEKRAAAEALAAERNAATEAAARAREERDRDEYERLKEKFENGLDNS